MSGGERRLCSLWRGLPDADFRAKLCAMAFNLKQWMKLIHHAQVGFG